MLWETNPPGELALNSDDLKNSEGCSRSSEKIVAQWLFHTFRVLLITTLILVLVLVKPHKLGLFSKVDHYDDLGRENRWLSGLHIRLWTRWPGFNSKFARHLVLFPPRIQIVMLNKGGPIWEVLYGASHGPFLNQLAQRYHPHKKEVVTPPDWVFNVKQTECWAVNNAQWTHYSN